jgi:hypothetical protein
MKNKVDSEYVRPPYIKPRVQLTGTDGNVFALLGRCTKALKDIEQFHRARELTDRVLETHSYDEALALMQEYVEAV